MKILNSLIKSIGLLLLFIFILQVGGLTCANDIYAAGPSEVQGVYVVNAADYDRGSDAASTGDLLSECQCPCHLNFSHIEPATVTSFRRMESQVFYTTELSIRRFSREILQPPKILI